MAQTDPTGRPWQKPDIYTPSRARVRASVDSRADLVARLRSAADIMDKSFDPSCARPWREAADEIERQSSLIWRLRRHLEIALDAYEDLVETNNERTGDLLDPNLGKPGHFVTQARKLLAEGMPEGRCVTSPADDTAAQPYHEDAQGFHQVGPDGERVRLASDAHPPRMRDGT